MRVPTWFHSRRRRKCTTCLQASADRRSWPSWWRGDSTYNTSIVWAQAKTLYPGWAVKRKLLSCIQETACPGTASTAIAGPYLQCPVDLLLHVAVWYYLSLIFFKNWKLKNSVWWFIGYYSIKNWSQPGPYFTQLASLAVLARPPARRPASPSGLGPKSVARGV